MEKVETQYSCVTIEVDGISPDIRQGLIAGFIISRLTRCSQENFNITLESSLAEGVEEGIAYSNALHAAVLNEMMLEAISDQLLRYDGILSLEKQE
jgi:hypothetical protein